MGYWWSVCGLLVVCLYIICLCFIGGLSVCLCVCGLLVVCLSVCLCVCGLLVVCLYIISQWVIGGVSVCLWVIGGLSVGYWWWSDGVMDVWKERLKLLDRYVFTGEDERMCSRRPLEINF